MAAYIADRVQGRDNNFNLIRIAAALGVMVSHAIPLTLGEQAMEPLTELTGRSLGRHAVAVFFVISGFLIARSFERRPSHVHWLSARALRLIPGLFVALCASAFILGPFASTMPLRAYFAAPGTWSYVPANVLLFPIQYGLPGVFEGVPFPVAVNGSLWTLSYEVLCYGGVFIAGTMGIMTRKRTFLLLALAFFLPAYAFRDGLGEMLGGRFPRLMALSYPFIIGMGMYIFRTKIPLDWRLAAGLWVVVLATSAAFPPATFPFEATFELALGYSTFWFAYVPKGALLKFNALGDYSYGAYIYAFPAQQLAVWLIPCQTVLTNLAISLPVTLFLAILSWRYVEKPCLAMTRPLSDRIVAMRSPRPA